MKKFFSAILALVLFFSLPCSSLADVTVAPLMESAKILLFGTENVTVRGKAVFSLDGERFKTAEILYKQAGEDSYWQLELLTPRLFRSDRETGFTIIANGEKIYVMERYYPGTYSVGSDQPNSTLIRQSTHADLLFSMLMSVADQMESLLPEDALSVAGTEKGRNVRISLSKETTPAIVNTSLNLVADFLLKRFMNVNYDSVRSWGQGYPEDYVTVTQAVLWSTDYFVLGNTDVTLSEDSDGRFTAASGTVTALLCSDEMSLLPLEITFDLEISDYGTTTVETFYPKNYGVVLRTAETQHTETLDPGTADRMLPRAKEILIAAGYDASELSSSEVFADDGFINVFFEKEDKPYHLIVTMNENGDLLNMSDGWEDYSQSSPREPVDITISEETRKTVSTFLVQAFPALFTGPLDYTLDLEYVYGGTSWQYLSVVDESNTPTGVFLIIRTDPTLKIVAFSCTGRGLN